MNSINEIKKSEPNYEAIKFESQLKKTILNASFQNLSLWSLLRVNILSILFSPLEQYQSNGIKEKKIAKQIIKNFIFIISDLYIFFSLITFRNVKNIVHTDNFNTLENGCLKNLNILNFIANQKSVIIVKRYKYNIKKTEKILYIRHPDYLIKFLGFLLFFLKYKLLNKSVFILKDLDIKLASNIQQILHYKFMSFLLFKVIYFFKRPKIVIYESPHGSFEGEICAAKQLKIKNTEFFHGLVTHFEPSYYHFNLKNKKLTYGICDEYIAPTIEQKYFVSSISNFKRVSSVNYLTDRITLKRRSIKNNSLLILASIIDRDLYDVYTFLEKNWSSIRKNYKSIYLRIHPHDKKDRWHSLLKKYPEISFSEGHLEEALSNSKCVISLNSTVCLKLFNNNIRYLNISSRKLV